ncbi:MAG: ABC transporter permease [Christensenella sp.]|nr:ABC transporter permease [Christensenella sp.]
MTFFDIAILAASNLWRRKMRTILTVLGVIIGTACIVIMVALGLGNLEQFNQSIMQNNNLTQIQISPMGNGQKNKLTDAKLNQIRTIPGVKNATGLISIQSYMVMGKYTADTSVYAVDPASMDFKFKEGAVFSDSTNIELVVGANARQYFTDPRNSASNEMYAMSMGMASATGGDEENQTPQGPDVDWVGMGIKYYPAGGYIVTGNEAATPDAPKPKEYRAKITGVLEQSDSEQSYNIYMSIPAANMLIRENRKLMENNQIKAGEYSQGYVNAVDVDSVQSVLAALKEMGLQAYSPTEWINQMQSEQARQQSQLIAIGLISLLVSAIGIANTMLASILERSREIGVMKVIGLSIRKINMMFLVEAAMIGLLGGLIGIGIGYIFAAVSSLGGGGEMNFLGMYFQSGVQLVIPWWLALGSVAIAVGVGVISGLYPAWKATKMSPLEAIRSSN